jgi:hypothetical protein
LQRARHKKKKREKLAKIEGEIFDPIHLEIHPEGQIAAAVVA